MNRTGVRDVEPEKCSAVEGEMLVSGSYESYLSDESRMDGETVPAIFFPENTAQVVDAVKTIRGRGGRIVVSGARTGVVGGAVGMENASIISTEKMASRLGERRFGAGVRLQELPRYGSRYYPVDPTETSASLGGSAATNASGARTYYYGPTRDHVQALTLVLADGGVLDVARGEVTCGKGRFVLEREGGANAETIVPVRGIRMPPVKNTAGLYLADEMDLIDLFIGSEGTLGIITEVEIMTAPVPTHRLFLVAYADSEDRALRLVEAVALDARIDCLAIEYFDPAAVALIQEAETFPNLPGSATCAVYLEVLTENEGSEDALAGALSSCGISAGATWAGGSESDMLEMKRFRHLIPEMVNDIIGRRKSDVPGLHKVATDTAVPEGRLRAFLAAARSYIEKEGMEYVVFGHIGDNHLHINLLPRSLEEMERAQRLAAALAMESVRLGGTVSAEHGIGRLKKNLLAVQFSDEEIEAMKAVKRALDPAWALNPGVVF